MFGNIVWNFSISNGVFEAKRHTSSDTSASNYFSYIQVEPRFRQIRLKSSSQELLDNTIRKCSLNKQYCGSVSPGHQGYVLFYPKVLQEGISFCDYLAQIDATIPQDMLGQMKNIVVTTFTSTASSSHQTTSPQPPPYAMNVGAVSPLELLSKDVNVRRDNTEIIKLLSSYGAKPGVD